MFIRLFYFLFLIIKYKCFWVFKLKKGYKPNTNQAKNFVKLLENSGPSAVKLGQILSTRVDIVGEVLAKELTVLEDNVKPFKYKTVLKILTKEFGSIDNHFFNIEETPIASASIAQVHRANLANGNIVAIKIVREDIEKKFNKDIKFFTKIAKFLDSKYENLKRFKFKEIVETLKHTIEREQNLMFEASAMEEMKENLKELDIKNVIIPKVYWQQTTIKVLTTEFMECFSVRNIAKLEENKINKKDLLINLINVFFSSVLYKGFFHADWHGGNILTNKEGNVVMLDFGMVGRLSFNVRYHLANMMIGFLNKDYLLSAQAHINAGWVPFNVNVEEFAEACRAVMSPLFDKKQADVSLGSLLYQLLEITKRFGMETQPELLLLQKNLIQLEGIGRILDPNENMWELATPIVNEISKKYITKMEYAKYISNNLKNIVFKVPHFFNNIESYKNSFLNIYLKPKPSLFVYILPWVLFATTFGVLIGLYIK